MLRPQDTATRERRNLDGLWDFAFDPEGVGRTEGWFRTPLARRPGARQMAVPRADVEAHADGRVAHLYSTVDLLAGEASYSTAALTDLNVPSNAKEIVIGFIIVLAVAIDLVRRGDVKWLRWRKV